MVDRKQLRIRGYLARLLFERARWMSLVELLLPAVVVFSLHNLATWTAFLTWWGVLLVVLVLRLELMLRASQRLKKRRTRLRSLAFMAGTVVASGLIWGFALPWLGTAAGAGSAERVLLMFAAAALSSLACATYASVRWIYPLYLAALFGPGFFWMLRDTTIATGGAAVMVGLYALAMFAVSYRISHGMRANVGLALQNAALANSFKLANERLERINEQVQKMARTDMLTGLPNRRELDARLTREWARAIRSKKPITILMVDVDNFKAYNDHYGHPMGDRCLARIAQTLATTAQRPGDLFARYGGEEFVVVLPDTDTDGAQIIAQRAIEAVREARVPHEKVSRGYVTVSIGGASEVPTVGSAPAALIERADQALYQAKKAGRDNVQFSSQQDAGQRQDPEFH